jgi:hypothetical protein
MSIGYPALVQARKTAEWTLLNSADDPEAARTRETELLKRFADTDRLAHHIRGASGQLILAVVRDGLDSEGTYTGDLHVGVTTPSTGLHLQAYAPRFIEPVENPIRLRFVGRSNDVLRSFEREPHGFSNSSLDWVSLYFGDLPPRDRPVDDHVYPQGVDPHQPRLEVLVGDDAVLPALAEHLKPWEYLQVPYLTGHRIPVPEGIARLANDDMIRLYYQIKDLQKPLWEQHPGVDEMPVFANKATFGLVQEAITKGYDLTGVDIAGHGPLRSGEFNLGAYFARLRDTLPKV